MSHPPVLTGNLAEDWKNLCALWHESEDVLMGEVGPKWEMPAQHYVCMLFADAYPDSKEFLIARLVEPDALVAAYAFKCLIRVTDLQVADLPSEVFKRQDPINLLIHSQMESLTLGQFVADYFDCYEDQNDLLEEQERGMDYQRNVLLPYLKATAGKEPSE